MYKAQLQSLEDQLAVLPETFDVLARENLSNNIQQQMQADRHRIWGLAIYMYTYESDDA